MLTKALGNLLMAFCFIWKVCCYNTKSDRIILPGYYVQNQMLGGEKISKIKYMYELENIKTVFLVLIAYFLYRMNISALYWNNPHCLWFIGGENGNPL